jgi:hypothetical protein
MDQPTRLSLASAGSAAVKPGPSNDVLLPYQGRAASSCRIADVAFSYTYALARMSLTMAAIVNSFL